MTKYPCADCIVKGICRKLCDETTHSHRTKNLYKRISNEGCCPDCGHTKGITFDGEYIYDGTYLIVMECGECYSSFYPTKVMGKLTGIFRFEKDWRTLRKRNLKSTTFWEYINDR